ncbi:alpha/beta hydrolase [Glycomyces sp. L485]|uniref:alpha/beta fold hydrolase n=1 Tax=Glycomyces sp. L485 TaxID=2909235 RepID=UPI001F4AA2FC|nr:alpha/beta fold hydrolase [Glycomyces sp. L485]MCH7232985.1 alpha/beta hydrolase [Glycomyces sp. L485]
MWFKIPGGLERRLRGKAPAGSEVFTIDCEGTDVWGYDWGRGPLVYLVHGWGGCTGDLDFIAAGLVANGYRVVAFDAPSHGNSGPGPWGEQFTSGVHLKDAMRVAVDKFGAPSALVAHSLGCLTAVLGLRESGVDFTKTRLVLMAPFVGGARGFADTLNSVVPAGPRIMERFIPLVEDRAEVKLADFSLLDERVESPALIVHDEGDRPNPFSHGAGLAEAWPNAELMATTGLGHRKILVSPAVNRRVTAFIKGD